MILRAMLLTLGLVGVMLRTSFAYGQAPPENQQPAAQSSDQGAAEAGRPRLELSTEEWDFGHKWHGDPCSTEITITNAGDAPLKILKIKSSCGCTALKPRRKELLPGESDTMTLTYNTKKNKEQVSQTITLETNDPERPRVTIQVKGVVKKVYDVKPDNRITFIRIERDSVATQSVELDNNMEEDVELTLRPFDTPPPFDIELTPLEAGRVYKLSATTRPPLKLGANSVDVVVDTGLEKYPSLTIPVSAYIAPRVYVRPARLWVAPEVTEPFQRFVKVSYRADQPIEIKEIKSSHPDLIKVEILPPRKPVNPKAVTRFHELRVTLPRGADCPEGGGRIEIYTDDPSPDYQKLVVEVRLKKTVPRELGAARKQPIGVEPASEPEDEGETHPGEPD
jgi:hypothetical protein